MHIKLKYKGYNFVVWKNAFLAANGSKGSLPAVLEAMPGTSHDSAALLLMYEYVPEDWLGELSSLPSAHDAYVYICRKFTGGYNVEANLDWLKDLPQGMRQGETI